MIDEDKDGTFTEKKKHLPLFLYHGKSDGVVQYQMASKSYEKLKASGFEKMEFYSEEYLPHSVSDTEIQKITDFLTRVM